MDQAEQALTFRCLPALENILPRPIPAVQGLPEWFKSMPAKVFDLTMGSETETVKRCPPFIDAMTYGFLIPLATDVEVRDGEFSWDFAPEGFSSEFSHSPVAFHDPVRSSARRFSMKTASSSNSTVSGTSRRRRGTRCCSPIRSIAPTCRSPRSPAWSTATRFVTAR
jgi:hypothetical protein